SSARLGRSRLDTDCVSRLVVAVCAGAARAALQRPRCRGHRAAQRRPRLALAAASLRGGGRYRSSSRRAPWRQQGSAMKVPVDFTSQEYFRNPSAGLARLRAAGPVLEVKFPIVGRVWITMTQELAGRVLKASDTFSLRKNGGAVAGLRWWMPGIVRVLASNMLAMDEPDHTRLRSIVDEAFRRRAVLEMEPRIFAIADELAANLFADGSPAALVKRYARRLPFAVISELLGLPESDRARFM